MLSQKLMIVRPVLIGGCGLCHTPQTKVLSANHQFANSVGKFFNFLTQEEDLGAAA